MSRAASSRRFSIALAGDKPVSVLNTRLNCRGLRQAASASLSTESSVPNYVGQIEAQSVPDLNWRPIQKRRVLRLSARTTMMQDEQPGSLADFFPADVALHQTERQVKAGCHSS